MQAGKPRLLYKVNKKRRTNEKKVVNKQKDLGKLVLRLKKEGNTKWLKNAIGFATKMLNRAGFKNEQLEKMHGFSYEELHSAPKATPTRKKAPTKQKEETVAA